MIKVKKGDEVIIGFKYIGLTTYEIDEVDRVSKGKIYTFYADWPFDGETGVNENNTFGAMKYIVTDADELEKAKAELV